MIQKKPMKKKIKPEDVKRQYQRHPSFADLLPFVEWNDEQHVFLLEDGVSVGALFELRDVAMEAKPNDIIESFHEKLAGVLSRVVPLEDTNPWVAQFFVQDDPSLQKLSERLEHYIPEFLRETSLSKAYLKLMRDHCDFLTREQGIFDDPLSGIPFRGRTRRIRLALYRRYSQRTKEKIPDVLAELKQVSETLIANVQALGIKVRRLQGRHVYEFLVRWFNPKPETTQGNVDQLLQNFPYPKPDQRTFGFSMTEHIFFNTPESFENGWCFDGLKHKVMVFREPSHLLDIGVISRERTVGDRKFSLLDKLPEGSIYTLQITFESKAAVEKHLLMIEASAVGRGEEPKRVKQNIARALSEMNNNNGLFRVAQALYYRGRDDHELDVIEKTIQALLSNAGLAVIKPQDELNPVDIYLRLLPFNFSSYIDKKYLYRSAYQYATDIAALLPLYGRSRGDGQHPLHVFFNRGGEPFIFDHFNPHFKMANSHMAVLGSTGAGKSVFLNSLAMQLLAVKNARVYILEAGGSFDLLAQFVTRHDKRVHRLKFDRTKPVAVNPFAEAYRALEFIEHEEALFADVLSVGQKHALRLHEEIETQETIAKPEELDCDENRDILSEMALAIRIMVTGGFEKEEERFTLSDDMLVMETLIQTLKDCKKAGIPEVLTSHVIDGFKKSASGQQLPDLAKRLDEMARSMSSYIKNPMKARFFNRPAAPLDDADLTVVDLGFLQDKQYASMLSLVAISLLAKVLAMAEANQYSARPTVLILDEAHILFKNPLVATFATLMSKVGRKFGLWLIPCTQNVEDFSTVESKKVLSMMETWLCLAIGRNEIENLKVFKPISVEEEALLSDVRKYPGLYSEGVLLGARYKGLFRNVPPRLALALAMTEQTEKAERQKIMDDQGITELEAAFIIAERLKNKVNRISEDEGFDD